MSPMRPQRVSLPDRLAIAAVVTTFAMAGPPHALDSHRSSGAWVLTLFFLLVGVLVANACLNASQSVYGSVVALLGAIGMWTGLWTRPWHF